MARLVVTPKNPDGSADVDAKIERHVGRPRATGIPCKLLARTVPGRTRYGQQFTVTSEAPIVGLVASLDG